MQASLKLDHLHYLDEFLLFKSNDYQTIKERISHYLCPHRFEVEVQEPLNTRLNGFSFGNGALYDLKYSAPVVIDIQETFSFYLFRITLEGECKVGFEHQHVLQSVGIMSVTHPNTRQQIVTNQDCRNIILKLSKQEVETQLFKMLGHTSRVPVWFDSGLSCTAEGISSIVETLNYLCHAYYNIRNWNFISASFTQYLIELILLKIPNNYSEQLNAQRQQLVPGYIKKAQQYIQDNLHQAISLATLGQYCEVSIRSLQKGFSQYLQQTPVKYIREQRLERVHSALQQAADHHTVTDILLDHGIQSFGHFSTLYKKRFGYLPSQTLKMNPVQLGETQS
ncbi:AraC family transcriptional regulator [Acinetobacter sp. S40]|uniref:AraC-like ligand-binding domain-containing protein n=1 Tax=unclassified Acinetobacter TaxID=196816 RepID=UPI001909FA93|nr:MULTISPECIES: AraC family transcriptional regulator [unclassified Acinetobacter]MBJ9984803.1 AraC family transcriptional regulator [Acinetobacter sp. S40]MBK0062569.1 AraC family transcriptional regulator [Acinetobacter sp. S55]MBK0066373.1 AraC family transcriptional regulator [Acinetobacter sp. S54]